MVKFKRLSKVRSITVPKDMAAQLDFKAGDSVDITAAEGKLIVTRHVPTCRFCGGAEEIVQFADICICPLCAEKLRQEVEKHGE